MTDAQESITIYEHDLSTLAKHLSLSPYYSQFNSVLKIVRQISREQASLLKGNVLDEKSSKELIKKLEEKLYTLLVENKHCATWFSKVVDRYCDADEQKKRLNHFMHLVLGPVIKLYKSIKDQKTLLAIEFPDQEIRDLFLNRSGLNKESDSLILEEQIIYFPAFVADNQQLGFALPSCTTKKKLIHMLNLDRANLISSDSDECTLYINDRRILDSASRFHIAVLCPYFKEYNEIIYASHMLAQVYRKGNGFFNQPVEIIVEIASHASSSDAISRDEKLQIAAHNFGRP